VVCRIGDNNFGVVVDRIFDTEEIVVKPVSRLLKDISVFSGNTILGDGSVIMILDPNGLAKMTGGSDSTARLQEQEIARKERHSRVVSFLLFKAGDGSPKAVPLELVSHLEEIHVSDIELSGDTPVIQYRDELMQLNTLHCNTIPPSGKCDVVVFTYDNKTIGLVVDQILDIVDAPLQIKLTGDNAAYLGSMVINGRTTDVVDVGFLLHEMLGDGPMRGITIELPKEECNVMLVEDSMFFRKLTVPFLRAVGYKVFDYGSAAEALEALYSTKLHFDAIVTDIEMPEMDGFQLADRIRSNPDFDHIPIIAYTSTINQQFVKRGEDIGMNDFILKTDRETLAHAILRLLSGEEPEKDRYLEEVV